MAVPWISVNDQAVPQNFTLLPQLLKTKGYATHAVGKVGCCCRRRHGGVASLVSLVSLVSVLSLFLFLWVSLTPPPPLLLPYPGTSHSEGSVTSARFFRSQVYRCLRPHPPAPESHPHPTHALRTQWHLGYTTKAYTPTHRGYDTFFGYYSAMTEDYWARSISKFLTIPHAFLSSIYAT